MLDAIKTKIRGVLDDRAAKKLAKHIAQSLPRGFDAHSTSIERVTIGHDGAQWTGYRVTVEAYIVDEYGNLIPADDEA